MVSRTSRSSSCEPVALVFEERQYNRPQLDAMANGLAASLSARGVTAGDRAALMASNRPEFVVALHAIWRLGAAVVLLSPGWKRDDIEHALLHGHPAVEDCAVFGVPDGVDGEAVVAAVATCASVDAAELTARVGERLASYKRPSRVVFVAEIPRLPSGKVLCRVLKESCGCPPDS